MPRIVVYHGARALPRKFRRGCFGGLHVGTYAAAAARAGVRGRVYEMELVFDAPYLPYGGMFDEREGVARTELWVMQTLKGPMEELVIEGYDVVPYINAIEDPGSVSYMIIDPYVAEDALATAVEISSADYAEGRRLRGFG